VQFVDVETASRIEFDDGRVLTRCDQCRQMYAERTPPGTPPCKTCRVELKEENEDAAAVYFLTRRQVVTVGAGQVVDISIPAVKIAMDLYGVKDQRDCLNRIRRVFHHYLKDQGNES